MIPKLALAAVVASIAGAAQAQDVKTFTKPHIACPSAAIYEQFSKAVANRDFELAAHYANRNGCGQFKEGEKHIVTDRSGWLCFSFREPGKFAIWHTCK